MQILVETYWPLLLVALLIGLAVAWFLFRANRKTRVQVDRRDVLDEGAESAQRNKALIDAPPAAGPLSSAAASDAVAAAPATADAEAGASVAPTRDIDAPDAAQPAPAPSASPVTQGDELTRIKGLGPKIAAILGTLGVTSFEQIAGWDDAEIERVDARLGRFSGRIRRDRWVEQAKLLAAGDSAGFDAEFGNS